MTDKPIEPTEIAMNDEDVQPETIPERLGPTVPAPHERTADVDRRIRSAVERMFEDVRNPYEAVIVASQEARRINAQRLKARSILNQAVEHVEELVPEVPFVPRPVEDDTPEIKPTNEAVEKMACGLIDYDIVGERKTAPSYYGGELDFELYPERMEDSDDASGE